MDVEIPEKKWIDLCRKLDTARSSTRYFILVPKMHTVRLIVYIKYSGPTREYLSESLETVQKQLSVTHFTRKGKDNSVGSAVTF